MAPNLAYFSQIFKNSSGVMSLRFPSNEVFFPSGFQPSGICSNALNLNPYGTDNFEISFLIKSYSSGFTQDAVIPDRSNFDR